MKQSHRFAGTLSLMVLGALSCGNIRAQYPKVTSEVRAEAQRRFDAMNRRSDEAFERALPQIEAWGRKGRPYIPGAAKPSDLPQADIPAFPGAQGGGMLVLGDAAVVSTW